MSGLINFIKSLFSGLFGIFSKKKEISSAAPKPKAKKTPGYFLEAEDVTGTSSAPAPVATAKAPEPSAPATTEEKKPSKRAAQLAAAKAETAKAAPAKPAEPAPAPQPAAAAKALNLPQPTVTTFAPEYLVPTSTNGRRRPGANMSSYLDMAKQVKVPNRA